MTAASQPAAILSQLQTAGAAYEQNAPGAREQLINLSHALISSLELPSEAIQRIGWAEVCGTTPRRPLEADICWRYDMVR